ncbi:MAG TPA: hypothetical protein VFZ78_09220 [Flavisolibacter sp.]
MKQQKDRQVHPDRQQEPDQPVRSEGQQDAGAYVPNFTRVSKEPQQDAARPSTPRGRESDIPEGNDETIGNP